LKKNVVVVAVMSRTAILFLVVVRVGARRTVVEIKVIVVGVVVA
jgi:hypothetical protein